ncbi:hypothetical protein Bbelb_186910 [Branchiostoma belcheri]|nr:hypothetical protein Bbelb_186910 [Branchiostoma belcheri]
MNQMYCNPHALIGFATYADAGLAELEKVWREKDEPLGIYKQYHYSPKAWRELKEAVSLLEDKLLEPINLGGTRWVPKLETVLTTLLHNFNAVHLHFENTVLPWTLYLRGFCPSSCKIRQLRHAHAGASPHAHMSMSDMDMTELSRKIPLGGFLHTSEEKLKENKDLEGPNEFFIHVRDKILQLPAHHKNEDLENKFDTFKLRLRIAQLSPRCYKLAMEFFKAEKARGHDLKASNFKWIQALSEEDVYSFLCKATTEQPVTRKLKEVAEEAEVKKAAN